MLNTLRSPAAILTLLAGLTGVLLVLYAWRLPPFATTVEMTDNAYVRGYVTIVSPQLSGYVSKVAVKDYEAVKAGQILVQIDDRIYAQKLAQAKGTLDTQKASLANSHQQELAGKASIAASEAQRDSANATYTRAQQAWSRVQPLAEKGIATSVDVDTAQATLEQAKAGVDQATATIEVSRQTLATTIGSRAGLEAAVRSAEAAVQLAQIDLDNTTITAPQDGKLGEVGARLGQYVTAGTQLMAIVPKDVWIIANFKETQLDGMKIGQPVVFTVDALSKAELKGYVEGFSPAAGSEFSVIRADNATGNFTKVAQRVGVRVSIDAGQPLADMLAPGMSVEVRIDKAAEPRAAN
ncbi:MAG TPA: HlyD family secretion protein [Pararhizobium sp.]|uniref:HlyD family secretion protein n=1 Tax=Pararhizobium sp. TaxID=1977563 RepID=UPI002CA38BB0|nr:HlyD family secretion protein [Pararhizobium sp.]HTO29999.1 HlyD family secretion protein [Pararhizobium sp.]